MSNGNPNPPPCIPPEKLKGVRVAYEDAQGVLHCEWLNLNAIRGITWCPDAPPPRPAQPPKRPLPTVPNGPDCQRMGAEDDAPPPEAPLCWWTGTEWECGGT